MPLAAIVLVTAVALALPSTPLPQLAILTPIAYFFAIVGECATIAVLTIAWRYSPVPRSALILAFSFGASAVLTLVSMLLLPLIPYAPPVIDGFQNAAIWLFISWHVAAAIGGATYGLLRAKTESFASRRFIIVGSAATSLIVAGVVVAALVFGGRLPSLATGTSIRGLISSGVGASAAMMLALATIATFRIQGPSKLDRAFAFSLLALTLELTAFVIGGHRYSASYFAGRLLLLLSSSFVLVSALQTHLASRVRLLEAEWKLSVAEDASTKRAGRIRALWQIASDSVQSDRARFDAVLEVATAAIRPGKPMFGCLSQLEDGAIVIRAVSWSSDLAVSSRYADILYVGASFPFERTLQSVLSPAGKTQAWNDLRRLEGLDLIYEDLGWQSLIGTPVSMGNRTYFLTFASSDEMSDQPYAEDDLAYVDVVAAFFSNRFAQELQFERIQFQIEHDALTGLKNRAQFRLAAREAIGLGESFVLAFLNLDSFRRINRERGHLMGDEILVEVATELAAIDPNNLVARMSDDEFGIVLRGVHSMRDADKALEPYALRFRKPFHTSDRQGTRVVHLEVSIGAARFPDDGTSAEELMKRADVALSQAKARVGTTTLLFDRDMEAILEETHVRAVEFADAIASDQLALVYQPTFDLTTRRIVGAEALVRWDHPTRGRLLPADFLPFVERSGQMTPLTQWVFRQLVRDIRSVELPAGFRAYFNLGAQTLDDFSFIFELNETLCATPGLVEHLGIEVTETVAMHNLEGAMHTINLFRSWGISVAIDDFGTGYSSLAYLKELTVDTIKIDRSFVSGLPNDERGGVITEMLLRVTDRFGFLALAEGVETQEQASWLLDRGCTLGQGYLICKPCSFLELYRMLDKTERYAFA